MGVPSPAPQTPGDFQSANAVRWLRKAVIPSEATAPSELEPGLTRCRPGHSRLKAAPDGIPPHPPVPPTPSGRRIRQEDSDSTQQTEHQDASTEGATGRKGALCLTPALLCLTNGPLSHPLQSPTCRLSLRMSHLRSRVATEEDGASPLELVAGAQVPPAVDPGGVVRHVRRGAGHQTVRGATHGGSDSQSSRWLNRDLRHHSRASV